MKPNLVTPASRVLRPHTRAAREAAAAIVAVAVSESERPGGGARRKSGAIRLSQGNKTGTVYFGKVPSLSWTCLFGDAAEAVLLVTTLPLSKLYIALAGLAVAARLRGWAATDLSARQGAIIYALWSQGGTARPRPEELILPDVNRELRSIGEPRMKMRELREHLMLLSQMDCITSSLVGWRLKERVWLRP